MRQRLAALTITAALLLPAFLLSKPAAAQSGKKDELVIGLSQFPASWHPAIDSMAARSYILGMARRPFTAYDVNWSLTCLLCTELPSIEKGTAAYEDRPDGTRGIKVTYTINPKASWGDGTPVTTKDVLFSWEVGRHPQSGYTNGDLFSRDIVGIDAADDRTFTVHRSRAVCSYREINDFELLPAHLEEPVFRADPANYRTRSRFETDTTNPGLYYGPYRITQVEPGSHVVLEQNPTWWGPKPAFRRVVVRVIENTAALEANLLAGQIDMVPGEAGFPLDQALALEKKAGSRFRTLYKPGLYLEHVELNLDNPILKDLRVRQALLLSIDREGIAKKLYEGRQPVAHNEISPLDRVHVPGYRTYGYDPAAAAKLLDEAGWTDRRGGYRHNAKGERLALEFMTTAGNRSRELLQQVLQAQWKQAGIEVRIVNEPARVFFGESLDKRRFKAMALFAWVSPPENIPRLLFHSTQVPSDANGWSGQNYANYANPEMDRLLDALETTCEPEANRALWGKLQALYAEELPNLPLYFRAEPTVLPPWLEGVEPTGHLDSPTFWIESWTPKG